MLCHSTSCQPFYLTMNCDLLTLWSIYPIAERLASFLGRFDLVSLGRTSSSYRALLHGFDNGFDGVDQSLQNDAASSISSNIGVRTALRIGDNNSTARWLNLLRKGTRACGELACVCGTPQQGDHLIAGCNLLPCWFCSRPVCGYCDRYSRNRLVFDTQIYNYHYQALCSTCYPASSIKAARSRLPAGRQSQNERFRKCNCIWHEHTRVCLACRLRIEQGRDEGHMLNGVQGTLISCARIGCRRALLRPLKPWGARYHVTCILCGLPRELEVPIPLYVP